MSSATLSSKFQILVPKDVRESLNLKPGQKLDFIQVGPTIRIVPQCTMRELFGVAAHVEAPFARDRSDLSRLKPMPLSATPKPAKNKLTPAAIRRGS